jgi:Lipase (class 3)
MNSSSSSSFLLPPRETATSVQTLSEHDWFVLKLQRLIHSGDDYLTCRLAPCCAGVQVNATRFHQQLSNRVCLPAMTPRSTVSSSVPDYSHNNNNNSEESIRHMPLDLFVPVRSERRNKVLAYMVRFRGRLPTYFVFTTGGVLGLEKWRLCLQQDLNSSGWHTGLYEMYHLFRDELWEAMSKLPPLVSSPSPLSLSSSPPSMDFFDLTDYPMVCSGLSAGAALATLFVHEYLTTIHKAHGKPQRIELITFGSPRVASVENAQFLQTQFPDVLALKRIVNAHDPVPCFPRRKRGYLHVGPAWVAPDCPQKPSIGQWRWPFCHGIYYGIHFESIATSSAAVCMETFFMYWWIFFVVLFVLFVVWIVLKVKLRNRSRARNQTSP